MKLTTSKYYIPSGRCIQAINYKHANGGYLEHIPDSLTKVFHTANGREVRDGGGIKPDLEVKPDSLPNIAFYLTASARDSTEVMLEYVIDYINSHPTIAPASEFRLTDADYADFKQRVLKSGFTYDPESEKVMKRLKTMMEFEGYMEDAKPEFEALEKKLAHNLDRDLDRHKPLIMQLLQNDIVAAYYALARSGALSPDAPSLRIELNQNRENPLMSQRLLVSVSHGMRDKTACEQASRQSYPSYR